MEKSETEDGNSAGAGDHRRAHTTKGGDQDTYDRDSEKKEEHVGKLTVPDDQDYPGPISHGSLVEQHPSNEGDQDQ